MKFQYHFTKHTLALLLNLSFVQSQVTVSVATDKAEYQVGEPVEIFITAQNITEDTLRLDFSSSCQTEYFIDDYYSVLNAEWGCLLSETWVIIPPGSTFTWHKQHLTTNYPLTEGIHTIIGQILDGNGGFTSPCFITVGNSREYILASGFYPIADTVIFDNSSSAHPGLIAGSREENGIKYVTVFPDQNSRFLVNYNTWNISIFENGFFFYVDSLNQYTHKLYMRSGNNSYYFPFDTLIYNKDDSMELKLVIYQQNVPIDSIIQSFRHARPLGIVNELLNPHSFQLLRNYPNPFNPITTIDFTLPISGFVTLRVYDLMGREIETLVDRRLSSGMHSVTWNGSAYPSGVYFIRMVSGKITRTQKMLLLK